MSDLLAGKASLADYQGCIFVGGFSYADVMESSRGWAGTIKYNDGLQRQFKEFYARPDTFSLGVCNGCQLMALLGWVPALSNGLADAATFDRGSPKKSSLSADEAQPRFI